MSAWLNDLSKLHAEATPGPWRVGSSALCNRKFPGECWNLFEDGYQTDVTHPCAGLHLDDAALIAAMRNALPRLLAAARWAEARQTWEASTCICTNDTQSQACARGLAEAAMEAADFAYREASK